MMKSFGRFVTVVLVLTAVMTGVVSFGGRGGRMEGTLLLHPVYGEEWPSDAFGGNPEETGSLGNGENLTGSLENGDASNDSWWEGGGELCGNDPGEVWPEEEFGGKEDDTAGLSEASPGVPSGNSEESSEGRESSWRSSGESSEDMESSWRSLGEASADRSTVDSPTSDLSAAVRSASDLPAACVLMRGGLKDGRGSWYYRADNCALEVALTPKSTGETRDGAFSEYKAVFHLLLDGTDYTDMADVETDSAGQIHYRLDAETVNLACGRDGAHAVRVEVAGYGQLKLGGNKKMAGGGLSCEGVRVQNGEAIFILDRKAPEFTVDIEAKNAEHKKPRKQGDRYYFNSSFKIRFTFYDENLEDDLIYVRRGEVSSGFYNSCEEDILSFSQIIPCRGGTASDRVKAEGIYRYMAGGCDKAGNALVPAEGAEADGEGRTRHIVVDRTKPSGTLTLTAGGWDIFRMDSSGSILADAVLPDSKEYGAVLCCSGEEEHSPVWYGISCRPGSAGASKQEDSGSFVRGLPWSVKLPGGGDFTIVSWTMEDLAGNRTSVNLKRHFVPVKQTGGLSNGGGTGTRSTYSGSASSTSSSGSRTYTGSSSGGSGSYGGFSSGNSTAGGSYTGRTSSGSGTTGGSSTGGNYTGGTLLGSSSSAGTAADRTSAGNGSAGGTSSGGTSNGASDRTSIPAGENVGIGGTNSGQASSERGPGASGEGLRGNTGQTDNGQTGDAQTGNAQTGGGQTGNGQTDFGQGNTREITDFKEKRRVISTFIRWSGEGKEKSFQYSFSTEDAEARAELVLHEAEATDEEEDAGASEDEPGDADIPLAGESLADIISFANNGTGKKASSARGQETVPTVRRAKLNILSADFDPSRIIKGGDLLYLPEEREWERELDDDGNTVWVLPLTFCREGSYHVNVTRAKPISGIIETLQSLEFSVTKEGEEAGDPGAAGGSAEKGAASETGGSAGAGGTAAAGSSVAEGDPAAAEGPGSKGEEGSGKAAIEIVFDQADACRKSVQGPIKPSFTVESEEAVLVKALKVNGKEQLYERIGNQISFSDALEEEGLYEITLSVSDAAGKAVDFGPVEIRIDNTPPHLEVTGIGERPETFYKKAELQVAGDLEETSFCELTLDGEELDPAAFRTEDGKLRIVMETEGRHSFIAQLKDEAGNVSPRCVRTLTVAVGPLGLIRTRPAIPAGIAAALVCLVCVIWIRRKEQGIPEEEEKPVSPWRAAHSRDLEQVKEGP